MENSKWIKVARGLVLVAGKKVMAPHLEVELLRRSSTSYI
jgi:hypothetical protein